MRLLLYGCIRVFIATINSFDQICSELLMIAAVRVLSSVDLARGGFHTESLLLLFGYAVHIESTAVTI
eukprot:SAG31_NODE_205_length_20397_cov_19.191152_9_plen_68_part_00